MTCGDMCNPATCTTCPFERGGMRKRRACKTEGCNGWLDYTDMGDLCATKCAIPVHTLEIAEEAKLHTKNQKPEVLTHDLLDEQAFGQTILEKCDDL